jgi:myo-inositol-1(or 4)-monophosphatase
VVFDAAKDEMFYAERGEGAWLNDSLRLRVSGRHRMIESIFATGLPFGGRADLPETLQDLARLLPAPAGVRRFGAASLDLAYVAAGRYEGYWERGLQPWDVAAGLLIAKEAGALVEPIDPEGDMIEDGDVIVANEPIFSQFAKVVRKG